MVPLKLFPLPLRGLRCAIAGAAAVVLCAAGGSAFAGEAGRIVFVSGDVRSTKGEAAMGDAIQEGDELSTGKNGYVYLKTVDNGLLILRPGSRARIVSYYIDKANPANTRVKLELLSGVARAVSGDGVKQARQNFRFNTPVAAIGVRGTDFTVYTDQETSNVTVLSGAIVVSGFGGACAPGGSGPCEHAASRELAAGQVGQVLQVKRGEAVPRVLSSGALVPDQVAPPRPDEPTAKTGAPSAPPPPPMTIGEPILDPQKASAALQQQSFVVRQAEVATPPPSTNQPTLPAVPPIVEVPDAGPVVTPSDPVVVPPTDPVVVTPPPPVIPSKQIVWGRWAAVMNQPATIEPAKLVAEKAKRMAQNSYYSIFLTAGADWQVPQQGTMGFALRSSEAFLLDIPTQSMSSASVQNGVLQVDFGKGTFATSLDFVAGADTYKLRSEGYVGSNGQLSGKPEVIRPTNMTVNGTLGPDDNAAYIFSSKLNATKSANGITYWTK
ncbi:hypothetical protein ASC94_06780 [Massilia sp. Root418]|uniref:FecR family protein n=1 Tax=Massilia sp. Root418 TaxID=1736532 RepID=UPI0006F92A76|nr:FecR family protein [Massilia sp. Root418]KQW96545.1 hypothetical protein ASC94_06780 [Massilia sp. Root418]